MSIPRPERRRQRAFFERVITTLGLTVEPGSVTATIPATGRMIATEVAFHQLHQDNSCGRHTWLWFIIGYYEPLGTSIDLQLFKMNYAGARYAKQRTNLFTSNRILAKPLEQRTAHWLAQYQHWIRNFPITDFRFHTQLTALLADPEPRTPP